MSVIKLTYNLKDFKNVKLSNFKFSEDAKFWHITLYPSTFVFVGFQTEINALK